MPREFLPTNEDAEAPSEQQLQFDRWRMAVHIVTRMREAGIHCQLIDDPDGRH